MNPALVAARAGLSRGWIEFKQTLTTPNDLIAILITTGSFLAAMIWTRHTHVPGMHFSLGTTMLVSVLGLNVVVYGVITMGDLLVAEREDGTLLRAKAIPNGMLGYLLGKVVNISGQIAFTAAITLLAGAFLFAGLAIGSPDSWLTLAWVLALGVLATLPLGAVLGSLFPSQRSAGVRSITLVKLTFSLAAVSPAIPASSAIRAGRGSPAAEAPSIAPSAFAPASPSIATVTGAPMAMVPAGVRSSAKTGTGRVTGRPVNCSQKVARRSTS